MNLGSVVDVGIGLILTYLIASLVASAVKEAVAGVFQWRGKYLTKGIDVLLSTTTNASFSWGGARAWVAAHLGPASWMAPEPSATAPAAPVAATAAEAAVQKVRAIGSHPLLKGTPSKLPSYVPARDFSTALLDLLRDGSATPAFSQVERTVAALPDCDVKRVLSAFLQDAGGDLDKLRSRIEAWFDDAMDRLSGIYKRFAQCFLLALGLLIAVVLNVDSVHLAAALWNQPALRAQMVADAQAELEKPNPTSATTLKATLVEFDKLPVPIGRKKDATFFGEAPAAPGETLSGWCGWNWWTMLGWLITALAISLGAPFWFDMLQNFMSLRSAGPEPQRADAAAPAAD
jgi:hypothetical protein